MDWLSAPFRWIWNTLLEWPLASLREADIYDVPAGWASHLTKAGIALFLFLAVAETYVAIRDRLRRRRLREMRLTGQILEPEDAYAKDNLFGDQLDAARHPDKVIHALKVRKDYPRLAEVYAGLNQPGEAAKWFEKAGDLSRAGAEYAKAGETRRAAEVLAKAGDHATAARFFVELGLWKEAAVSYAELGATAEAGLALCRAGNPADAAAMFQHYFQYSTDGLEAQVKAAGLCLELLRDEKGMRRVGKEAANVLRVACAQRLYRTPQRALAVQLFQQAGVRPPA